MNDNLKHKNVRPKSDEGKTVICRSDLDLILDFLDSKEVDDAMVKYALRQECCSFYMTFVFSVFCKVAFVAGELVSDEDFSLLRGRRFLEND